MWVEFVRNVEVMKDAAVLVAGEPLDEESEYA